MVATIDEFRYIHRRWDFMNACCAYKVEDHWHEKSSVTNEKERKEKIKETKVNIVHANSMYSSQMI